MANSLIFQLLLVHLFAFVAVLCEKEWNEENGGLTIHLHRQKTAFEQQINNAHRLEKYGINMDWLYKKHHGKPGPKRTNDSVALYRYLDNEFYGQIVIGHPGQIFNVAFDTAWALSWVISAECHVLKSFGCLFHNKYDHTKSSEWKPSNIPVNIPEGKYNLTGYFSYDNISIAHSNVTDFLFAEMTYIPFTYLFNKVDGVMGLGLKKEGDEYEPFFYTLVREGKIPDPTFCIYLNRDKQSKHGGNVIMGFIEKRHIHSTKDQNNNTVYDTPKYMPVKPGYLWQFDLDSIFVLKNKNEIELSFCTGKNCQAITDTSSNNILGPMDAVNQIHKTIKARPFFLNRYTVDCETINKLPVIGFVIGGQNFTLKGRDYTVKLSYFSVTMCLSAFVPHDYQDFWVLGGAFLSEYFTIYKVQEKQIGFVKAA